MDAGGSGTISIPTVVVKKKRGTPRKYDGTTKERVRPRGSGRNQQLTNVGMVVFNIYTCNLILMANFGNLCNYHLQGKEVDVIIIFDDDTEGGTFSVSDSEDDDTEADDDDDDII
uniref:Uncharacterized protein n=1 Tax=Tanacetum cinerariifolium TaxID=118510 RepID=A0A6L2JT80_TANCI|nr:hypothetical protein [Tanacetum cinerariifolium]